MQITQNITKHRLIYFCQFAPIGAQLPKQILFFQTFSSLIKHIPKELREPGTNQARPLEIHENMGDQTLGKS